VHCPAAQARCNLQVVVIINRWYILLSWINILRSDLKTQFVCLFVLACGALTAASIGLPESIVENYQAAAQQQEHALQGSSMEVDIHASLPNLKKRGRLQGLRRISRLGRITYEALRFEGDNTVKSDVIAKYLSAETQAQSEPSGAFDVTPANYKFKYRGVLQHGDETVQVFAVTPRHKRAGLFKGDIWIDSHTFLRVRESGQLVKNPSIFVKKIEFVREYEIQGGVSVPRQMHTVVQTRLVGPAELTIDFRNVALAEPPRQASLVDVDDQ
jgi:hypothetical protein